MSENLLEAAIKEANSALPTRKLNELIERTSLSADMKALLIDVASITAKVAGTVITIGRKILTVVLDLVKVFPSVTLGVLAALVISALIASIPLVGGLLAGALSSVLLLVGVGKGALQDLSSPALEERITSFVNSLAALKEA